MKIWILIGLLALLFLWSRREHYATSETAGSAKKSGYDEILKREGQTVDYQKAPEPGASQTTSTPGTVGSTPPETPAAGAPVGSTGMTPPATGSTPPIPGSAGMTSGNTTGGGSTSSAGPNSGGSGGGERRKQVFGPLFTGIGDGGGDPARDSSKTSTYPELLGGGDSRPSTRVDGAGIVPPSKNWQLATGGSLPTMAGLGSEENSKYLPTSRVPGDMEKIPDPWRVSQSYSASNNSYKSDPVPFLTDFSAFQK